MIRRLQIKLITTALLAQALVLVLLFGIVAIRGYCSVADEADQILAILAANEGRFPDTDIAIYMDGVQVWSLQKDYNNYAELPYESRYFSVVLTDSGSVLSSDMGQIAAVDEATAISYAQSVQMSGRVHGFVNEYRYRMVTDEASGTVRVIFLDCGRLLSSYLTSLITAVIAIVAGLTAVLIVMILLSKRIIRPIVESYDKQRRFITDAGHEIKTPLTIINADAEVLAMEVGEDNEWLLDIQSQTHRLTELTKSLILLSRMQEDAGDQDRMIEFPVSDIVTETAQSFQSIAKTHNRPLTCHIQQRLTLRGDEKGVRQNVSILLANAQK